MYSTGCFCNLFLNSFENYCMPTFALNADGDILQQCFICCPNLEKDFAHFGNTCYNVCIFRQSKIGPIYKFMSPFSIAEAWCEQPKLMKAKLKHTHTQY